MTRAIIPGVIADIIAVKKTVGHGKKTFRLIFAWNRVYYSSALFVKGFPFISEII